MPGAGRPHGPPAKKMQAAGTTGSTETSRHSPRDGWAAYTSSPRGPAVLPPSRTDHRHRPLGLSTGRPGPYDFAGASGSFVRTIARAAIQCTHRIPHPRLVTIAKRPSWRDGIRIINHVFLKNESRIFSVGGLDKGDVLEAVSKNQILGASHQRSTCRSCAPGSGPVQVSRSISAQAQPADVFGGGRKVREGRITDRVLWRGVAELGPPRSPAWAGSISWR